MYAYMFYEPLRGDALHTMVREGIMGIAAEYLSGYLIARVVTA